MSLSQSLLDELKAKNGGCSDYRAAKLIGCSAQNISRIKTGTHEFSPDYVARVASLLGTDPKKAVLKRLIEQAKTDEMREIYEEIENLIPS